MKAVLMSIQPKWCTLIEEGKKTVEVRKSRPKLQVPFKVYIYCTKPNTGSTEDRFYIYLPPHDTPKQANGKVIGEFVCDEITTADVCLNDKTGWFVNGMHAFAGSCLTEADILSYCPKEATVFGWHISELVIYDKPRGLRDFQKHAKTEHCGWGECDICRFGEFEPLDEVWICRNVLTKPPQSWYYVEEVSQGATVS